MTSATIAKAPQMRASRISWLIVDAISPAWVLKLVTGIRESASLHDLPHGRNVVHRIAISPQRIRHVLQRCRRRLGVRHIQHRRRRELDGAIVRGRRDADDFDFHRHAAADRQPASNRIPVRKVGAREQIADHARSDGGRAIALVDLAARQQRNLHRREESGTGLHEPIAALEGHAVEPDRMTTAGLDHRGMRQRGRAHPWNLREAIAQLRVVRRDARPPGIRLAAR